MTRDGTRLLRGIQRLTVAGLRGFPSEFWSLWSSTLVNRLGTFVFVPHALPHDEQGVLGHGRGPGAVGVRRRLRDRVARRRRTHRVGRRATMAGGQPATAAATAALGLVTEVAAIAVLAAAALLIGGGLGLDGLAGGAAHRRR